MTSGAEDFAILTVVAVSSLTLSLERRFVTPKPIAPPTLRARLCRSCRLSWRAQARRSSTEARPLPAWTVASEYSTPSLPPRERESRLRLLLFKQQKAVRHFHFGTRPSSLFLPCSSRVFGAWVLNSEKTSDIRTLFEGHKSGQVYVRSFTATVLAVRGIQVDV